MKWLGWIGLVILLIFLAIYGNAPAGVNLPYVIPIFISLIIMIVGFIIKFPDKKKD